MRGFWRGIAIFLLGGVLGTGAGVVVGTPAYMSPEQATGADVDKRTDIWAFGCVLWEMLTGHRLFTGDTPSAAISAVFGQPIALEALPPSVPPRWGPRCCSAGSWSAVDRGATCSSSRSRSRSRS